jgi:RIO-like serine/threonine protein kinase
MAFPGNIGDISSDLQQKIIVILRTLHEKHLTGNYWVDEDMLRQRSMATPNHFQIVIDRLLDLRLIERDNSDNLYRLTSNGLFNIEEYNKGH